MKMRNKGNINLSFPGTSAKFRVNDFAENQIGLFVVNDVGQPDLGTLKRMLHVRKAANCYQQSRGQVHQADFSYICICIINQVSKVIFFLRKWPFLKITKLGLVHNTSRSKIQIDAILRTQGQSDRNFKALTHASSCFKH